MACSPGGRRLAASLFLAVALCSAAQSTPPPGATEAPGNLSGLATDMRIPSTPKHPDHRKKSSLESFEAVMNLESCLKAYSTRVTLSLLVVTKVLERIQDLSVSRRGAAIAVSISNVMGRRHWL